MNGSSLHGSFAPSSFIVYDFSPGSFTLALLVYSSLHLFLHLPLPCDLTSGSLRFRCCCDKNEKITRLLQNKGGRNLRPLTPSPRGRSWTLCKTQYLNECANLLLFLIAGLSAHWEFCNPFPLMYVSSLSFNASLHHYFPSAVCS